MLENVVARVGHSKFGTIKDVNVELCWESIKPAFETTNLEPKDVDFFVVSNVGIRSSEVVVPLSSQNMPILLLKVP